MRYYNEEYVHLLKRFAERNKAWAEQFGAGESMKVIKAVLYAVEELEKNNRRKGMIKVLVKSPDCPPYVWFVDNDYKAMQKVIGGKLEAHQIEEGWCILCDEEGRIKRRSKNCKLGPYSFVGRIMIVGVDGEEFTSFEPSKEFKETYPQLWRW